MISKTSKEKFVKSKSSEEKVQNIHEIYDAIFQNSGNSLAELPIIMNLRLTDLVNEILLPGPVSVTWLCPRQFVTFSSVQCNFPDMEVMKIKKCSSSLAPCPKFSR